MFSFNDGMAFAALIHSMDNDAIDFDSLNPKEIENNLSHAFEVAETKLGIPRLLEVEDVMNGNVDERAMILYNSLFFHAYNADAEKRKMQQERESIADQLSRLQKENESFKLENAELRQANDDKDARIAALEKEIEFLRKANREGNELRKALEEKIRILQALLDENESALLNEKNNNANADAGAGGDGAGGSAGAGAGAGSRGMGVGSASAGAGCDLDGLLNDLESERDGLLSDREAKERYLAELEARKNRLLSDMEALRKQVAAEIAKRREQDQVIAELREALRALKSKEIINNQARIGLDVLRSNLEEHLEDLYRWRELNNVENDDIEDFDLAKVTESLQNKSFEEQLTQLDGRLQEENRNLARILKLQGDQEYLDDTILQAGWLIMKGRKDWSRRWFIFKDNELSFFLDETCTKHLGSAKITGNCTVVRQMAVTDEETKQKLWPLKVTIEDKKLFLRAESKKDRLSWFAVLSSRIALLKYLAHCESTSERPDTRLIGALKANSIPIIYFGNRPVSEGFMGAFVKGILGRDELDSVAFVNSSLTDNLFTELLGAVSKLPHIKRYNFSKNKITSGVAATFAESVAFKNVEDLDLSYNQLNDEFLTTVAPRLPEGNLNSLVLDGNQFSAAGVKVLVDALLSGDGVALPELCLSNNKLGDDGVNALLPLFSKISFKSIRLAGNGITDSGVSALVNALSNSQVEEIDLSQNNISSTGAVALRDFMNASSRLHSVSLSGNKKLLLDDKSSTLFASPAYNISELTLTRA